MDAPSSFDMIFNEQRRCTILHGLIFGTDGPHAEKAMCCKTFFSKIEESVF